MRRHSPDQMLFLMAIAAVMLFTGFWFPLVDHLVRGRGLWLEISAGALPVLVLIGVLVFYWRISRG